MSAEREPIKNVNQEKVSPAESSSGIKRSGYGHGELFDTPEMRNYLAVIYIAIGPALLGLEKLDEEILKGPQVQSAKEFVQSTLLGEHPLTQEQYHSLTKAKIIHLAIPRRNKKALLEAGFETLMEVAFSREEDLLKSGPHPVFGAASVARLKNILHEFLDGGALVLSEPSIKESSSKGKTYSRILSLLQNHRLQYPYKLIKLADIARQAGVSRQYVNQTYHKLREDHNDLPLIKKGFGMQGGDIVMELITDGFTDEKIMELIGIEQTTFRKLLLALEHRYSPAVLSHARLQRLYREERNRQIAKLRNENLGNREIERRLGIGRNIIDYLVQAEKVQRRRKRNRTDEELAQDDHRVKTLREQGKNTQEIADILNTTVYNVTNSIQRLYQRDELERIFPYKPKKSPEEKQRLAQQVKELRNKGRTNSQIAEALGETPSSIRLILDLLLKKGEIEKRPPGQKNTKE